MVKVVWQWVKNAFEEYEGEMRLVLYVGAGERSGDFG